MKTLWDEKADEVKKRMCCVLGRWGQQITLKKSAIG